MYAEDLRILNDPSAARPKIDGVIKALNKSAARLPKIISLFSGAGGLDLGFKQAGFPIAIAIDQSEAAVRSHQKNFPHTQAHVADLVALEPAGVVAHARASIEPGQQVGVIGGPPCQGFSRANTNGAQSCDPRNRLPALYLEIVGALQSVYTVEFLVFENVLGIRDKRHEAIYRALLGGIAALGFEIAEHELCALDFGVPQSRRRIVLSGLRAKQDYPPAIPRAREGLKTVREAIGGLAEPTYYKRGLQPKDLPIHPNHWTMQPKSSRFERPDLWKADGRSFKRLNWDAESPTVAYGHREIHIHPNGHRRLSIYEAMLLQGFPKWFVLEGNFSEQVEQVSNAVPPPLARSVARAIQRSLNWRSR